jgi:hypothetical protein
VGRNKAVSYHGRRAHLARVEERAELTTPNGLFGLFASPYENKGLPIGPDSIADFNAIVDGTIDGRIEFFVWRGSMSFLDLGQGHNLAAEPGCTGRHGQPCCE